MGVATLGPPNDTVAFRIDPEAVDWNFVVNTSVQPTVGGRVVQIVGATLSDITVTGSYGEEHARTHVMDSSDNGPGRSWRLAETFVRKARSWMVYQSQQPLAVGTKKPSMSDSNPPLRFTYAPYGWDFHVFIKDVSDPTGGVVSHTPGKFSYKYTLTLFILEDNTADLGILRGRQRAAIDAYIERIAKGVGWERYDPKADVFQEQVFSGYTVKAASLAASQAAVASAASGQGTIASSTGTPGSDTYTARQIAALAYSVGFRNGHGQFDGHGGGALDWAVAIALAESRGYTKAENINTNHTVDRGLWQINSVHGDQSSFDVNVNAEAAWEISGHGHAFTEWATYAPDFVNFAPNGPAAEELAAAQQAVSEFLSTVDTQAPSGRLLQR